jgi:hypothetical protein
MLRVGGAPAKPKKIAFRPVRYAEMSAGSRMHRAQARLEKAPVNPDTAFDVFAKNRVDHEFSRCPTRATCRGARKLRGSLPYAETFENRASARDHRALAPKAMCGPVSAISTCKQRMISRATRACCSGLSPGYIGRDTISAATFSDGEITRR